MVTLSSLSDDELQEKISKLMEMANIASSMGNFQMVDQINIILDQYLLERDERYIKEMFSNDDSPIVTDGSEPPEKNTKKAPKKSTKKGPLIIKNKPKFVS